mmetsp:Transcript_13597/g.15387  ORF Transcript_13597/g.15387 Transcript_13597/m.15387 type:complete len:107 (-) Transcript_13597:26-346(-)
MSSVLLDHGKELCINEEMSFGADHLRTTKSNNSITELNVFGRQQSAVGVVDTGSIPIDKKLVSGQFGSVFLMRRSSTTNNSRRRSNSKDRTKKTITVIPLRLHSFN